MKIPYNKKDMQLILTNNNFEISAQTKLFQETDLSTKQIVFNMYPQFNYAIILAEWKEKEIRFYFPANKNHDTHYRTIYHYKSVHLNLEDFIQFYNTYKQAEINSKEYPKQTYYELTKLYPNTFVDTNSYEHIKSIVSEEIKDSNNQMQKIHEHGFFIDNMSLISYKLKEDK
jgi:hypothetical protein